MFLRDQWYAVAWTDEVKHELLARTICGEELIFYRCADGTPAALEDLCCHRMLPLSHGTLIGDRVRCGYHGLTFERSGQCVSIPCQESVPPQARVRAYPVVEKHRLVWVWIGDPARADESLVPDFHWTDDPGWRGAGGTYRLGCDYRLVIDNLMDLTHETYVHHGSIGNDAVAESPIRTEQRGDRVVVTRWMLDHEPAPFWRMAIDKAFEGIGTCDRWQMINYSMPANIVIDVGVAEAGTGAPEGDRSRGITAMILNSITPETETSCWYFWCPVRNYDLDNTELTEMYRSSVGTIFLEDVAVLEAQQRAMTRHAGRPLINISADAGSLRARRLLERAVAAQAKAADAA
jgi:vanillate O-demethylase monooxygenase subunit